MKYLFRWCVDYNRYLITNHSNKSKQLEHNFLNMLEFHVHKFELKSIQYHHFGMMFHLYSRLNSFIRKLIRSWKNEREYSFSHKQFLIDIYYVPFIKVAVIHKIIEQKHIFTCISRGSMGRMVVFLLRGLTQIITKTWLDRFGIECWTRKPLKFRFICKPKSDLETRFRLFNMLLIKCFQWQWIGTFFLPLTIKTNSKKNIQLRVVYSIFFVMCGFFVDIDRQ